MTSAFLRRCHHRIDAYEEAAMNASVREAHGEAV